MRNLGKAFYENPTTQKEAVEQFRQALQLAPKSVREQLNYGLALLRAGRTAEGVAELEQVQKKDPALPHTWFNLGIVAKKAGESDRALAQFRQFVQLVPNDAVGHYNLGALLRTAGDSASAVREFETAAKLDHTLAAPHFQLFNLYRTTGRAEDAKRELAIFQGLKKQQEGAAIPEDVEWNAYAEIYDPTEPASVPTEISPRFEKGVVLGEGTKAARFTSTSLVLWSSSSVRIQPGGTILDNESVVDVSVADYNNDALPDLCVLTAAGPRIFVNSAGKLAETTLTLPKGAWKQALWIDYDHDYDLDLMLVGANPVLLRNAGAAGFEDRTSDFPFVAGEATSAAMLRIVPDTKGFDVIMAYSGRPGVLYRDQLQGHFTFEEIPLPAGARDVTVADTDNDGAFDVVFRGPDAIYAMQNAVERFQPPARISASAEPFVFADPDLSGRARALEGVAVADLNGDGREDLVRSDGKTLSTYLNRTAASGRSYLRVQLEGIRNLKLAHGAEVEVKAGRLYQKKQYAGAPLLFAAPASGTVDTVRITWPNGLIQNEVRQAPGRLHSFKEAQRLSGSCPMIWSWNGTRFEYITDVLGVAPLGAAAGDGEFFPVDHDEYIQIPGTALAEQDGRYEIRVTEELSEVAYLDGLRLLAVDRPSDAALYTGEKFKGPPFPEFRLYSIRDRVPPVTARDGKGRDVLPRVLRRDNAYPDNFGRTMSGLAELHSLELDFGSAPEQALLVLHGWVDWADGSTFLGLSQEKRGGIIPPYLQVKDQAGRWVTVIDDMGMPAGKPKSIVVDLRGKFLSDSREIRIVTNFCVYWDEIFLSPNTEKPSLPVHVAPLESATLRFRGFSTNRIHPKRTQPERFTYEGAMPVSLWNPTPGMYTRYGDVRELAASVDDKLIVMGSGDELRLSFDAGSLPPVKKGWSREFLLHVDGWAKDRDANTAHGQSTTPLPYHAMSVYPYPSSESFPSTAEHRDWQDRYLTRPALRLIRPLR